MNPKYFVIICCINILFLILLTFYSTEFQFVGKSMRSVSVHCNINTNISQDSPSVASDKKLFQTDTDISNKPVLTTTTSKMFMKNDPAINEGQREETETHPQRSTLPKCPATLGSASNSSMYLTTVFTGRLGNHLFIYAMLLGVARSQDRVPFISDGIDIGQDFQISFIQPHINSKGWRVIEEFRSHTKFVPTFFHLPEENLTLSGSFQSWKYFQHIQAEIRREFTFSLPLQEKVQTILAAHRKKFLNHAVVGIHARRGDFLEPKNIKLGYEVPNGTYFEKAMSTMKTLLGKKNVTFLVASDDLTWCQENLNDSSVSILPQGEPSFHLALLASCDHVIISGGTFGWWAAWLANGITIYFKNYVLPNTQLDRGFDKDDYYLPGWIGLEN
nr:galactoside 2-alpha-L-fucosyltransferase 1-like isoform X2 [Biomphalaria glabrata]